MQKIGFWNNVYREKTPHSRYLLQIEQESFAELAASSSYPIFSSSYYLRRKMNISGRVDIPIADSVCQTDFYLVCLASAKSRYDALFDKISEKTIL